MDIGRLIKEYREENGLSQRQFAQKCGVSNGYISMLEEGKNPKTNEPILPTLATMRKISSAMGCSLNDLMSSVEEIDVSLLPGVRSISRKRLPMLGNVACGEPLFADEQHDAYVDAADGVDADFCLIAKGDSMINARIFDGDLLFVKRQESVDDGEIAVVLIEEETTVKRVYYDRESNLLTLVPENPTYRPMRFAGSELSRIRILGKVVAGQYVIR